MNENRRRDTRTPREINREKIIAAKAMSALPARDTARGRMEMVLGNLAREMGARVWFADDRTRTIWEYFSDDNARAVSAESDTPGAWYMESSGPDGGPRRWRVYMVRSDDPTFSPPAPPDFRSLTAREMRDALDVALETVRTVDQNRRAVWEDAPREMGGRPAPRGRVPLLLIEAATAVREWASECEQIAGEVTTEEERATFAGRSASLENLAQRLEDSAPRHRDRRTP